MESNFSAISLSERLVKYSLGFILPNSFANSGSAFIAAINFLGLPSITVSAHFEFFRIAIYLPLFPVASP